MIVHLIACRSIVTVQWVCVSVCVCTSPWLLRGQVDFSSGECWQSSLWVRKCMAWAAGKTGGVWARLSLSLYSLYCGNCFRFPSVFDCTSGGPLTPCENPDSLISWPESELKLMSCCLSLTLDPSAVLALTQCILYPWLLMFLCYYILLLLFPIREFVFESSCLFL